MIFDECPRERHACVQAKRRRYYTKCQVQIAYDMPDASYYPLERGGFKAWATTIQTIGNKNEVPVVGREDVSRLTELELYCADAAQKLGAEWLWETTATVLVQNENGDVTGVIGEAPASCCGLRGPLGMEPCA